MTLRNLFSAGLVGLCATGITLPTMVDAQNVLRIMRGASTSSIKVSVNRAIVMESEMPFAELSVANPGIADIATLSDRTIYVLGKSPGRTTLTLLGADGQLLTNVDVHVSPDLAEFKERLREILPKERIEVRTANDGIVLSGRVSGKQKLQRALDLAERYAPDRVTNLMVVGGIQQVMLKVRFAEMQRSVAKNLSSSIGVNVTGNTVSQVGTGAFLQNPTLPGTTGATNTNQGAFSIGFTSGDLAINLLLEALETKGLVRTLAEPNIVAISGNESKFLAGGEFPVPVADGDGIKIDYKPFGIELKFKPVVVQDNLIQLTINTAVSEIDTTQSIQVGNTIVPAFSRREAQTVVEMHDGQSMAIAGLLQDDFTDLASQVPWIGDVPILGALFRSANYNRQQSELVVIVTPHLVTPVDSESLALPTDRVRIPNEAELFLLGNTQGAERRTGGGVTKGAGTVESQDLTGSYGYVME
ncbi:MAG: type II and III secretion system protein family protein [Pseudomonadota bacterium]